jgi:arsenical pump membrane protein
MVAHWILAACGQGWPPFVLVAGLLLVGAAAGAEGLFEAAGGQLARTRLPPRALLLALLGLVAAVTAVLNLDTAVVLLTPVLVHAARRRGLDEQAFLYGTVFMANAASLLLPGSNLTNQLVLGRTGAGGAAFGARMLPAWLASCAVTAFCALAFRPRAGAAERGEAPRYRPGPGRAAVAAAAAAVVALPRPALPVLGIGLAACALGRVRPRLDVRALGLLLALAVGLGTLARAWHGPAALVAARATWRTAAVGALASVLVNNLPAAVLLSAQAPPSPGALLVGLDLGPNLAVTGSLSAVLWLEAARSVGARASVATYSRLGVLLVPASLAAALLALRL